MISAPTTAANAFAVLHRNQTLDTSISVASVWAWDRAVAVTACPSSLATASAVLPCKETRWGAIGTIVRARDLDLAITAFEAEVANAGAIGLRQGAGGRAVATT